MLRGHAYQHVSPEANVSHFLQSFWVQLFASNHMSFQAIYPRLLPWHYNDRQYQNNIVHC